jgi:thioesterase domain-containing protein
MSRISASHANTAALFAMTPRSAERVILPINDSALASRGQGPAFFCVHSVSGVAGTDFLDLAQRLDPGVAFYGFQAPPKVQDPEFGRSLESLAEHYADALIRFQPQGPLMLGGYCVGGIIALEMAKVLRRRGREVGPLVVIDGIPENTGDPLRGWRLQYWAELVRNIPGWFAHSDLMRGGSFQSLVWSIFSNMSGIGKSVIGLKRGEKWGGGFAIDTIMDLKEYPLPQKQFINRLFGALFAYTPEKYTGEVVVYEAKIRPLLYLPQIGRTWLNFAPQSEVVEIVGTHRSMMHPPYIDRLAADLRDRVMRYFSASSAR